MIFTTNKPMNDWGKVLHDEDMAAAILDRVLERGRFIHLDGPSGRTRHLNPEETLPENTKRLRISGIAQNSRNPQREEKASCGNLRLPLVLPPFYLWSPVEKFLKSRRRLSLPKTPFPGFQPNVTLLHSDRQDLA
jgi:hypothetical protein